MSLYINDFDQKRLRKATKKEVRVVRNHLQCLGKGFIKPKHVRSGICLELNTKYKVDSIREYIATWPKLAFPACETYPIYNKEGNYYQTDGLGERTSMWDRRTKVGKLRCELCLHIAAELSKELCEGVYDV